MKVLTASVSVYESTVNTCTQYVVYIYIILPQVSNQCSDLSCSYTKLVSEPQGPLRLHSTDHPPSPINSHCGSILARIDECFNTTFQKHTHLPPSSGLVIYYFQVCCLVHEKIYWLNGSQQYPVEIISFIRDASLYHDARCRSIPLAVHIMGWKPVHVHSHKTSRQEIR